MLQLVEQAEFFSPCKNDPVSLSTKTSSTDSDTDTDTSASRSLTLDSEQRRASISSSDFDQDNGLSPEGKTAAKTNIDGHTDAADSNRNKSRSRSRSPGFVRQATSTESSLASMSSVATTVTRNTITGSESVSTIEESLVSGDNHPDTKAGLVQNPDSVVSTSTLSTSKDKLSSEPPTTDTAAKSHATTTTNGLNSDGHIVTKQKQTNVVESTETAEPDQPTPDATHVFKGLKDYPSLSVMVNKKSGSDNNDALGSEPESDAANNNIINNNKSTHSHHNYHDYDDEGLDPISPATIVPQKPFASKAQEPSRQQLAHAHVIAAATTSDRVAVRHSIDSALSMDSVAVSPNLRDLKLLRTSSNNSNASSSFSRPSVSSNYAQQQTAGTQTATYTPFKQPHNYALAHSSVSTQGSGSGSAMATGPGPANGSGSHYRNSASSINSINTMEKEVTKKPSIASFHRPSFSLGSRKKSSSASATAPYLHQPPLQVAVSGASTSTSANPNQNNITNDELQRLKEAILARREAKKKKREFLEDERVLVGTKVSEGHANFVTAYNMLTGIRVSVSRCNAKVDRELTDEDFRMHHKLAFDISGNELIPSAKYDFKFKDYAPWVFRHLRDLFKLDPADYLMSLTSKYIVSQLGSPGKSGSFFYFSRDFRFIIKTIHHSEHKQLRKILKDYYYHVKSNPNTLISQFYGLHRVKLPFGRKIHFIVMNNLFPPHRDIHRTYDLKGSTLGREYIEVKNVSEEESKGKEVVKAKAKASVVYKDVNWVHNNEKIRLGPKKRKEFLNQLEIDVALLKRLNIMDYSLLLGIHDLTKGNSENIRDKTLHVFEPGSLSTSKVAELRKALAATSPTALKEFDLVLSEYDRQGFIFYADSGGYRATDANNEPLDDIYYLGVIDCLTPYKFSKKVETFWKGLSNNRGSISAVPANEYGDRFFKFIKSVVTTNEPDDAVEVRKSSIQKIAGPSASAIASTSQPPVGTEKAVVLSQKTELQAAESAHENSPLLPSVVEEDQ